jgi:hypothetical protein
MTIIMTNCRDYSRSKSITLQKRRVFAVPSPGTLLSSLTHRRAFQRSAQLLPVRLLRHLAQTIANKVRHFSFSRGSSIHLSARCDGTMIKHDAII